MRQEKSGHPRQSDNPLIINNDMSKIDKNLYPSIKSNSSPTILDTLEITSDYFKTESHASQYRQAIRKQSQIAKLKQLIDVAPIHRQKQYWKTWHCNRVKLQQGNKIQGSLCRKRWCQHCNRIKTAELIKGYQEPLNQLTELYFVTLTAPTVSARQLRSELRKRYKAFTRIKDNVRKNHGVKLVGIRKTEVTYNEETNRYHPHFHLIVQGKREAELIQALWLKQFKTASIKAQDIRAIDTTDSDNLIEVFKYATKDVTKDSTTAKAMDTIYTALQGIRTIQTYGSISKVKEPKEETTDSGQIDWLQARNEIWVYEETEADYFNAYDERLIDTKQIINRYEQNSNSNEERDNVFNENVNRAKETIQSLSEEKQRITH